MPVEHTEIQHDDDGDEDLENGEELALRDQIGLAGLVNQLRDLAHRPVHRQVLQLVEDDQTEQHAQRRHAEADHEQHSAVVAAHVDGAQIGQHQVGFAASPSLRRLRAVASGCCAITAAGAASISSSASTPWPATPLSGRIPSSRCLTSSHICAAPRAAFRTCFCDPTGHRHAAGQKNPNPFLDGEVGEESAFARIHHDVAQIQMVRRHVHRDHRLGSRGRDRP